MVGCQAYSIPAHAPWAVSPKGPGVLTVSIIIATLEQVHKDSTSLEDLHARITVALTRSAPAGIRSSIDDMAQAAVIKLMRQDRSENELAELRPSYLWRVVHSEIMDEIRRCRRRAEVGLEEVASLADIDRPDVERTVAGRCTGEDIRSCLGLLVDSRRRVVALYLMGHQASEIAELLGISKKQAENLVFRGVRDLRSHLRERGYGHDAV